MRFIDVSLDSPAENLALDEALLCQAEAGGGPLETLRLWEFASTVVVAGRGSRVEREVNRAACSERNVPILRRTSGGAAIVGGPGCLMYSVVLSYDLRPELRMIEQAHRFVLGQTCLAIKEVCHDVGQQGTSDLTLDARKFSGNSLRCGRTHLLYHGTLLIDFALHDVSQLLLMPPRQPEYREGRRHDQFLMNLPATSAEVRTSLAVQWQVGQSDPDLPLDLTQRLVREKYSCDSWNFRL